MCGRGPWHARPLAHSGHTLQPSPDLIWSAHSEWGLQGVWTSCSPLMGHQPLIGHWYLESACVSGWRWRSSRYETWIVRHIAVTSPNQVNRHFSAARGERVPDLECLVGLDSVTLTELYMVRPDNCVIMCQSLHCIFLCQYLNCVIMYQSLNCVNICQSLNCSIMCQSLNCSIMCQSLNCVIMCYHLQYKGEV